MSHELHVDHDRVYGANGKDKGDYSHVIAGLKGTTHNERVSEPAREHAEALLADLEHQHDNADYEDETQTKAASSSKSKSKGKNASSASSHGHTAGHKTKSTSTMKTRSSDRHHEEDDEHHHRVIGGLKANLHRSDRSEETKDKIRDQLRDMGEEVDD